MPSFILLHAVILSVILQSFNMLVEIMLSGNMLSVVLLEVPYLDFDRNILAYIFITKVPF